MVTLLAAALFLLAVACIALGCVGHLMALPGAAIALGFLLLCAVLEAALRGLQSELVSFKAFLDERNTYKAWKEYRKEHPQQLDTTLRAPSA
jgi:hypothetical protein